MYEGATLEREIKQIKRSLYIRRFSTGSMSVYVFSYLLGLVVRFVLPYDPRSVANFYLANIVQYFVQFLLFLYLDRADWLMTPDWVLSAVAKALSGKFRSGEFARASHLEVRPVGVFAKPGAAARVPECVELRGQAEGEGVLGGEDCGNGGSSDDPLTGN